MFEFFKIIGKGFLFILISPFALAYYAIYFVCSLFLFLFMFAKRVYMFFKGEDMKAPLYIDKEAKRILDAPITTPIGTQISQVAPQTSVPLQPIVIQPAPGTIIASGYAMGPNGQPIFVNVAQSAPTQNLNQQQGYTASYQQPPLINQYQSQSIDYKSDNDNNEGK